MDQRTDVAEADTKSFMTLTLLTGQIGGSLAPGIIGRSHQYLDASAVFLTQRRQGVQQSLHTITFHVLVSGNRISKRLLKSQLAPDSTIRSANRTEDIMLSHFFKPSRRISAVNGLLNNFQQRNWHSRIEVNKPLAANNLKCEVPLTIKRSLEVLLSRTGDNVINNLGFADSLICHIPDIPVTDFGIVAWRWQVDQQGHYLERPFIVLLLAENLPCLQENDRHGDHNHRKDYS